MALLASRWIAHPHARHPLLSCSSTGQFLPRVRYTSEQPSGARCDDASTATSAYHEQSRNPKEYSRRKPLAPQPLDACADSRPRRERPSLLPRSTRALRSRPRARFQPRVLVPPNSGPRVLSPHQVQRVSRRQTLQQHPRATTHEAARVGRSMWKRIAYLDACRIRSTEIATKACAV